MRLLLLSILCSIAVASPAQGTLKLKAGAPTVPIGALAHVERVGKGPVPVVLLTCGGLGWQVWSDFMARNRARYTCYAVELPGDAGTACYPMPDKPNYMEQEWVNGAADAVIALIKRRRMKQPLLIGENLGAAQVLVRAALREPSLVRGIVNIAGRPSYFKGGPKVREMVTDQQSAPFFDKVDEATWHQGNWKASQLSINPSVGDQLARDQDSPLNLTAEVTWQLEFGTIDLTEELPGLKAPLLVFDLPGLTLEQTDENNRVFYEKQYGSFDKGVAAMNAFYTSKYGSRDKARADLEKPLWADAVAACPGAKLKVEHGTGIFMTKDIPDEIDREIASFVTALSK